MAQNIVEKFKESEDVEIAKAKPFEKERSDKDR